MKKLLFLYLPIGSVAIVAAPAFAISSHNKSYSLSDQNKLNFITANMVKKALNILPDANKLPSTISKPNDITTTLNGLNNVTIKIDSWQQNDEFGTIRASILLSRLGLVSPPKLNILYFGFLTSIIVDQAKLDHITKDMVINELKISKNQLPTEVLNPNSKTATLNGLKYVEIKIVNWIPNNDKGAIDFTVILIKSGLATPPKLKIHLTGFLTQTQYDQQKMNGITGDMLKKALNIPVNYLTLPSEIKKPKTQTATLNGLKNVAIKVIAWTPNDEKGYINATVIISKKGLKTPSKSPFTLKWIEFQQQKQRDQILLNSVTSKILEDTLNLDTNHAFADEIQKPADNFITINKVKDVKFHFFNWIANSKTGIINTTIILSKKGLSSPNVFNITLHDSQVDLYKKPINFSWTSKKIDGTKGNALCTAKLSYNLPSNVDFNQYNNIQLNLTARISDWNRKDAQFYENFNVTFSQDDLASNNPDDYINNHTFSNGRSKMNQQWTDISTKIGLTNNGDHQVLEVEFIISVNSIFATKSAWGGMDCASIYFIR